MSQRRWYNAHLPQTLGVAQFLLYFDAAFALLAVLQVSLNSRLDLPGWAKLFLFAVMALSVYGAQGIANEEKLGYRAAVVASFLPLALRIVVSLFEDGIVANLDYILLGNNILNVLFEYALIVLLLHPMSKQHQKIWFS